MTTEVKTTVEPTIDTTPAPDGDGGGLLTNHDVKNNPLFQKLAAEHAALKKAQHDREAAEQAALKEAEAKKLEAEGKYQEALAMREKEVETLKQQYQRDILQRDLKTELYRAGFQNEIFVNGAIAAYKDGDVAEYAKSLAADEGNKIFLATAGAPPKPTPPGAPTVSGQQPTTIKTPEEYHRLKKSDDPAVKKQARAYGARYFDEHGRMP